MPAAVVAAVPALQMVSRSKDRIAVRIDIEILRIRLGRARSSPRLADFSKDRLRVIPFPRETRDGLKARTAEARRRYPILHQAGQDVAGHNDLMTPAGTLVEMSLGDSALIIATAKRTTLIPPQTFRRRRAQRGIRRSGDLRVHELSLSLLPPMANLCFVRLLR